MASTLHITAQAFNIARPVCAALLGKHHTHSHRMAVGVFVMAVGVCIAKASAHVEYEAIAMLGDGIGYGIHGLGLTPFLEFVVSRFEV